MRLAFGHVGSFLKSLMSEAGGQYRNSGDAVGLDGRVASERSTWPPLRRAAEVTLGGKLRDKGDEHIALLLAGWSGGEDQQPTANSQQPKNVPVCTSKSAVCQGSPPPA